MIINISRKECLCVRYDIRTSVTVTETNKPIQPLTLSLKFEPMSPSPIIITTSLNESQTKSRYTGLHEVCAERRIPRKQEGAVKITCNTTKRSKLKFRAVFRLKLYKITSTQGNVVRNDSDDPVLIIARFIIQRCDKFIKIPASKLVFVGKEGWSWGQSFRFVVSVSNEIWKEQKSSYEDIQNKNSLYETVCLYTLHKGSLLLLFLIPKCSWISLSFHQKRRAAERQFSCHFKLSVAILLQCYLVITRHATQCLFNRMTLMWASLSFQLAQTIFTVDVKWVINAQRESFLSLCVNCSGDQDHLYDTAVKWVSDVIFCHVASGCIYAGDDWIWNTPATRKSMEAHQRVDWCEDTHQLEDTPGIDQCMSQVYSTPCFSFLTNSPAV